MTEQTEQPREIATINNKHYFKDSMSEDAQVAFEQAIEMNQKIAAKETEIRDLKYARQFLINFVEDKSSEFKEYIPEEEDSREDSKDGE